MFEMFLKPASRAEPLWRDSALVNNIEIRSNKYVSKINKVVNDNYSNIVETFSEIPWQPQTILIAQLMRRGLVWKCALFSFSPWTSFIFGKFILFIALICTNWNKNSIVTYRHRRFHAGSLVSLAVLSVMGDTQMGTLCEPKLLNQGKNAPLLPPPHAVANKT